MANRILITPRSLTSGPHPQDRAPARGRVRDRHLDAEPSLAERGRAHRSAAGLHAVGWPGSSRSPPRPSRQPAISASSAATAPASTICRWTRSGQRNIAGRHQPAAPTPPVSPSFAVALIFSALRHIPSRRCRHQAGGWPRRRGRELRGRNVAVIGCGAIGGEVVRDAGALGANVLALRSPAPGPPHLPCRQIPLGRSADRPAPSRHPDPSLPAAGRDGKPILDWVAPIAEPAAPAPSSSTRRARLWSTKWPCWPRLSAGTIDGYATDVLRTGATQGT